MTPSIYAQEMVETGKLLCLALLSAQVLGAVVFGNSVDGMIMARNELEASREQMSEIQNGIMQLVEMLENDQNNQDLVREMEFQIKQGISVISELDNIEDMKMMFDSLLGTVVKGTLALDNAIAKSSAMAVENVQSLTPFMGQLRQLSLLGRTIDEDLSTLNMAVDRLDQSVMMKRNNFGLNTRQYGLGRPPTAQEKANNDDPRMAMSDMVEIMKRGSSYTRTKTPPERPKEPQDYYRTPDVKPQQPSHNYDIPPNHPGERPPPQPTRYPIHGPPDDGPHRPPQQQHDHPYDYGYGYEYSGNPNQYRPPYPFIDPRLDNQPAGYDYDRWSPQRLPEQNPSPIKDDPYDRPEPRIKPTPRMAIEDDDVDPMMIRYNPNIDEEYANFIKSYVN